jgi:hypothetical protein
VDYSVGMKKGSLMPANEWTQSSLDDIINLFEKSEHKIVEVKKYTQTCTHSMVFDGEICIVMEEPSVNLYPSTTLYYDRI